MKKVEELRALSTPTPEAPAPEGGVVSHRQASDHAANSDDPLAAMLRDVDDRLNRDDPDIPGARVSLHGARLAASYRALATREDHHERNLSMTNDELIEQALSSPPLEAPAEAGEEFATAEAMAEAWSDRIEIQRMVETTSAVFARWASPDLLSRFRQQMMGVIQQAYIEGVGARVEALRAQPPAREDAQPVAYDERKLKKGDQVWIRATVTDPCTSCCGVSVKSATGSEVHRYIAPADVRAHPAPDALRVAVSDAMVEAACSRFVSESDDIWSASVWPEGPDDDGDRGDGGRVRLISEADQHNIRTAMRFALTDALAAPQAEQKGGFPGGQEA